MSLLLAGARVVTPRGSDEPGWVRLHDSLIVESGAGAPREHGAWDLGGGFLLPGFVDLHVHGGGGYDVATGPADLAAALAYHRRHGTTRSLVSLAAAPVEMLIEQLRWVADLADRGPRPDCHVVGAHLEGPFLSRARCGAQDPDHLLAPDRVVLARLLRAGRGHIRTVTLAPELPGALDLVADIVAKGAVAAVGHTDATYDEAAAGFAAGARLATHLFNGMPALHHRDPGPVGAALDAGIPCEIINDGRHVHPAVVRLVARSAPWLLVTDAFASTGMGNGRYRFGGRDVTVVDGEPRLAGTDTLAGSTLTMDAAVRRAVLELGLPVESVAAAAATRPARLLGLGDRCGAIRPGLAADLVHLDDDMRLTTVISGGVVVR